MSETRETQHSDASQAAKILRHLRSGKSITPKEAMDLYGCYRLGARIWELNEEGHGIDVRMVDVPGRNGRARVAEYFIPAPAEESADVPTTDELLACFS